jgi:hypothetical protein
LRQPDVDFERAAEHVLRKNEELYRRLALRGACGGAKDEVGRC